MKAIIQLRKDSKGRDGAYPLILAVHFDRVKVKYALGESCRPEDFTAARRVRRNAPAWKEKNMLIERALAKANEIFVCARLAGISVTAESFRAEWTAAGGSLCLLNYAEQELARETRVGVIGIEASKQYKTALKKLRKFWPNGLQIGRLTQSAIEEFDAWHQIQLKKKFRVVEGGSSARIKALQALRKFWRSAERAGLFKGPDPWVKFHFPRKRKCPHWLAKPDLAKIEALYDAGQYKAELRPFLFSCYTGLRLGDVCELNSSHIVDGKIVKQMDKNHRRVPKTLVVPLGTGARKHLEDGGFPLMTLTPQHVNRALKVVANALNLKMKLTYHMSRHTFATLIMDAGGTIDVVQELLGHSSITHTLIYAHVAGERKGAHIALLDNMMRG